MTCVIPNPLSTERIFNASGEIKTPSGQKRMLPPADSCHGKPAGQKKESGVQGEVVSPGRGGAWVQLRKHVRELQMSHGVVFLRTEAPG